MDRSYNNQCNAITNSARASCNIVNSPHTSRKAFHQCPHPCRPNCWLTLANSLMQFGQMGRRAIHVSDPDWNLNPDMIYLVHVWTHNRPVHEINIMSVLKCHRVAWYIWRGIVLHRHKDPSEEPSRPCDSSECRCSDACWSFHPGWSRCSPLHDGLHSWPWLMARHFYELAECRHPLASHLGFDAPEPYHYYGIGRTRTHPWRCSVSCDEGPRLCASGPTNDDVAYAPKPV